MNTLTGLRREVMQLWQEGSNDTLTFRLGLAYLRKHQPRVLWLGFSQSDDWAHARRYDRLLDYLRLTDGFLKELWGTLQSLEQYAGRTTLIVTTDHGRGRAPADWHDHGAGIEGSQDIWIAIVGPDTPDRGEMTDQPPLTQSQVAATMLALLGLDPSGYSSTAAPPVMTAIATEPRPSSP
jgi:arylsulfatase A-like enzyme